ncbi:cation diffusion facilitator family transporter [Bacillus taeanensis]|uniref:Cation diffusion facilitator family transporter n=1 Tax=Bacillus taeanensis TaxID=273032 RepID=A0A366XUS4_9BACI|nr:cation diffusion facilitator family transporter [Bacillus taeanensis]RBW70140.1 cation diffusion facilitator family transporter [Bacillus taeanensis]
MNELFILLKKGSKSALLAAIINTIISIIKGFAYMLTGNVAMFAETMHSLGDAANQFFVFIGSALSKKAPTARFPNGFGRLVNLVLLGAVLVVGIMAYETIIEGYHHILHPTESEGLLINVGVLAVAIILEAFVLFKAMKETLHDVGLEAKGMGIVPKSFANVNKAKPATKLVFLEDLVATLGGLLALAAVLISQFTPFHQAEGIASIIIGLLMFYVVGKIFLDNAAGVLGEADEVMQNKIGSAVLEDPDVRDVQEIAVLKEGDELHVEIKIEVDPQITLAEADDIKDRIEEKILKEKGVTDVIVEFDEDDKVSAWENREQNKER